ncbi:MAG: chalcone isomerase family protein [Deltaproteobacteria bacterium]|nr:chalcone isomerase family protein [Kofleriaceae bacterium]
MRAASLVIPFLIGVLATPVLAGKKADVTMPDRITVGDRTLTLNGMGLREATWAKVDVYVAGLYLEKVSSDATAIIYSTETKRIVLRFKRHVDRSDILGAWHSGFRNNATVPLAKIEKEMKTLDSWMPAFSKGHELSFTYLPGQGIAVDINGTRKGVIAGEDFARSLFAIWLGPKPPTSALKSGMLSKH